MIQKSWAEAATLRQVDNRNKREYTLQLILERDALREYILQLTLERNALRTEVQRLRTLALQIAQRVDNGEYSCYACDMTANGQCAAHKEVVALRRQAMKETVRHE